MTSVAPHAPGFVRVRLFALGLGLLATACTSVKLISDYDEGIDRGVTELQKSTEAFLLQVEHTGRPGGPDFSREEQQFLDQSAVAVTALQIRAAAVPGNDITLAQLALLKDSYATLGSLLKAGVGKGQVLPIHDAFNTSTGAILKLELAKRRGEAPAK